MSENDYWSTLKNKRLDRTLTEQELEAVDWWVSKVLYTTNKYKEKKSIVSIGHIPNIVKDFNKHAGDSEWEREQKERRKYIHDLLRGNPGRRYYGSTRQMLH